MQWGCIASAGLHCLDMVGMVCYHYIIYIYICIYVARAVKRWSMGGCACVCMLFWLGGKSPEESSDAESALDGKWVRVHIIGAVAMTCQHQSQHAQDCQFNVCVCVNLEWFEYPPLPPWSITQIPIPGDVLDSRPVPAVCLGRSKKNRTNLFPRCLGKSKMSGVRIGCIEL